MKRPSYLLNFVLPGVVADAFDWLPLTLLCVYFMFEFARSLDVLSLDELAEVTRERS